MGFKFRKRIKLFPGCSINLSKSGPSVTLGPKGCSVNVGKNGTFLNTSIPGTGVYDRVRLDKPSKSQTKPSTQAQPSPRARRRVPTPDPSTSEPSPTRNNVDRDDVTPRTTRSEAAPSIPIPRAPETPSKYAPIPQSSEKWQTLKIAFIRAQQTRAEYEQEAETIERRLAQLRKPIGFKSGKKEEIAALESRLELLRERTQALDPLRMNDLPSEVLQAYRRLADAFRDVCGSRAIWNYVTVDDDERSNFGSARFAVDFNAETTTALDSTFKSFQMKNAQNDSIYVYPTFLVLTTKDDFALIDFADLLSVSGSTMILQETGHVPSDARIVETKRVGNTEVKSTQYFRITIASAQGLDETFVFSALEPARRFCAELANYRRFYATR